MPVIPSDEHERPEPSQTQMLKDRRFKLSRACDRCRRRRIKCDEGHPCQACLTAKSACTFEEAGKKPNTHKTTRRATSLEERMNQLESMIQSIPANIFHSSSINGIFDTFDATQMPSTSATLPPHLRPGNIGVPPPSLSVHKLTNPGTHFVPSTPRSAVDNVTTGFGKMSIAPPTFLYYDDEGSTRWQGETSGLPLLEMLVERRVPQLRGPANLPSSIPSGSQSAEQPKWFPDRQTQRRVEVNPEMLWRSVTSAIPAELMDTLVQQYLSTTYYLLPFLHVPTFLHDYGNPTKWGEPGFACFIVAMCCIASRQVDDPRVRSDPADSFSCGSHWFDFFTRLRTLPTGERPTLYTVQAVLIAAVYATGMGRLSKGFALLAEAVTLSHDAGLHRSVDAYDCFDTVEKEVRSRTLWCVYMWDKQIGSSFGRPPLLRLRDCDVPEPNPVDDEYITATGVSPPPIGGNCRMAAFVAAIRYYIVLESVLDAPPASNFAPSSFLARCTATHVGFMRDSEMVEEEVLLDEVANSIPAYWQYSSSGLDAKPSLQEDVIQVTQSHRLHCLEQVVRMYIHRHRLSSLIAAPSDGNLTHEEAEMQAMLGCHQAATSIIHSQLEVATHGLMGFFGVGAIHQLNQAGRTLVAVLLNCKTAASQERIVGPAMEALKSCVLLLRRFSVRYLCGLRSADLIEEFCRVSGMPLSAPPLTVDTNRRAWVRPVRKKTTSMSGIGVGGLAMSSGGSSNSPPGGGDHPSSESSPQQTSALQDPAQLDFESLLTYPPNMDLLALLDATGFDPGSNNLFDGAGMDVLPFRSPNGNPTIV